MQARRISETLAGVSHDTMSKVHKETRSLQECFSVAEPLPVTETILADVSFL